MPESRLPRYFAKNGHIDADPKKVKKDGNGKANWGRDGDEVEDLPVNLANARRRSNSSTHAYQLRDFKTKFEQRDEEPVFEEDIHGPSAPGHEDGYDLEKEETISSAGSGSVDEEDIPKKSL